MLHVGSAVGPPRSTSGGTGWRSSGPGSGRWSTRRIETPHERLAWLIVLATIPAGILGLAFERPLRLALAKPTAAAFFLILNGFILLGAERLRRRTEVRVLAARAGRKGRRRPATRHARLQGGRRHRRRPVLRSDRRHQPRRRVHDRRDSSVGSTTRIRPGSPSSWPRPIILAAGVFKLSDLTGPLGAGVRAQALVAALCAAVTAVVTVRFLIGYFKTRTLTPFGIYCLLSAWPWPSTPRCTERPPRRPRIREAGGVRPTEAVA